MFQRASLSIGVASVASILLLCAAPVRGQVVKHESLTDWTHVGSSPNWTDDVPHAGAEFGKVDQLNSIPVLTYTSNPLPVGVGAYTANCRLMKFQDSVGVAPIDFVVLLNGNPIKSVTLEVADQVVDQFVRTPNLTFSVQQPGTTVSFILVNSDTNITKQNYYFDSFLVGEVDLGPVMHVESMGRTWGKSWGAPYFLGLQPDVDSIFGFAEQLAYVWWMDWHRTMVLQPGTYTANVRAKKLNTAGGGFPIDLNVIIAGSKQSVTWTTAEQTVGQYAWTGDLVFDVLLPNTSVRFEFWNVDNNQQKRDYLFDAFTLRKGAYSVSGQSCPSSLGAVTLHGNPPQLGELFTVEAHNVPSAGAMLYGVVSTNVNLTPIGMTGCFLYTNGIATIGFTAQNGVAAATFLVPNNPVLAGKSLFNQAVAFDPGQNPLGLVSSERGKGEISR